MTGSNLRQKPRQPRPNRWLTAVFIYVVLIFFFLFQGGKTSFMLLAMATVLGIYWISGMIAGIRKITGKRMVGDQGHKHFVADSRVPVQLDIHVRGWMPLPYIVVNDELQRFGKMVNRTETVVTLDAKRHAVVRYQTPPLARGCYQFMNTVCWTKDIFGLFEQSGSFQAAHSLYVLPQILPISVWKQNRSTRGAFQLDHALSKDRRESTNLNGIREYALGDKLSRVHWNATAKTGHMKSKQFEPEGLPPLVLVLDLSVHAYERPEHFETAVSAMASMAAYVRTQQRRTIVVGLGDQAVIWTDEDVRYESLPFRQWLASVQRERAAQMQQDDALWMDKWMKHPELRRGGVVLWVSGLVDRMQMIQVAALAKRNWYGTYVHIDRHDRVQSDVSETTASLLKYRYQYVRITELQELPVRLGGPPNEKADFS